MKYEHYEYKDFYMNIIYTRYSIDIHIEIPINDYNEQLSLKFNIDDLYSDRYDNVDEYQSKNLVVLSMAQRHMYERKILDIKNKVVEVLGL